MSVCLIQHSFFQPPPFNFFPRPMTRRTPCQFCLLASLSGPKFSQSPIATPTRLRSRGVSLFAFSGTKNIVIAVSPNSFFLPLAPFLFLEFFSLFFPLSFCLFFSPPPLGNLQFQPKPLSGVIFLLPPPCVILSSSPQDGSFHPFWPQFSRLSFIRVVGP